MNKYTYAYNEIEQYKIYSFFYRSTEKIIHINKYMKWKIFCYRKVPQLFELC